MKPQSGASGGGARHMLAAAFFFSVMSLFVKLAGRRLPTSEIVLVRSAVMLVMAYLLLRRAGVRPWGVRKSILIVRGVVGFCALMCFFYAVTKLPLADVSAIHFTNPVFTAVLAAIFLHESMRRRETAGLLLNLVGVALVAQPEFLFGAAARNLDLGAVLLALVASLLSAGAYTTIRKLGETEHHLVIVFYFALVSTVGAAPLVAGRAVAPTLSEWGLLAGIGVVTLLAQISLTQGLHRERAGKAVSIGYAQVVFAGIWGLIFFGDKPNGLSLAGAALILVGLLMVAGVARESRLANRWNGRSESSTMR
jgi:drug/metabolite transporter (DMT)-like permease